MQTSQLKTLEQLKQGECIIITKFAGYERKFYGQYDEKLKVVFCIIPQHYKILGYVQ